MLSGIKLLLQGACLTAHAAFNTGRILIQHASNRFIVPLEFTMGIAQEVRHKTVTEVPYFCIYLVIYEPRIQGKSY